MYLPVAAAETNIISTDAVVDPLQSVGEGSCILVVEDNAQVGEFAVQALAELGYRTQLAADGPSALEMLGTDSAGYDVVFSDVVMPGMSGVELAQEIGRRYPLLPVILTSGYSSVLADGGTQGFELLHKPYSIDELSRVLRRRSDRAN